MGFDCLSATRLDERVYIQVFYTRVKWRGKRERGSEKTAAKTKWSSGEMTRSSGVINEVNLTEWYPSARQWAHGLRERERCDDVRWHG